MRDLVLDPSKEHDVSEGFVLVETEVDFLRLDTNENRLWIRGDHLCRWVAELYRARGTSPNVKIGELSSPRVRLRALIGSDAEGVSGELLKQVLQVLDRKTDATLSDVLSRLSDNDEFWRELPSIDHAARWLLLSVKDEFHPLVEEQRKRWVQTVSQETLRTIYEVPIDQRETSLREWLCPDSGAHELGVFPIRVQDKARLLLEEEWGRRLRATDGAAVENFSPSDNPNGSSIAHAAYEYFRSNVKDLSPARAARISSRLSALERSRLNQLIPVSCPAPLSTDASVEEALAWTVDEYLPFRQWQVRADANDVGEIQRLGDSFADWVLNHYPSLTTSSRENSALNVCGRFLVDEEAKQNPVLWVVVDGLNYANHRLLLRLLGETESELGVVKDLRVLSVLPTVTEKAKYALTSGMFPQENKRGEWGIQRVFQSAFPSGEYAGETQIDRLHLALAKDTTRVCYWNMTAIDAEYHKQTDPHATIHNIEKRLEALARNISDVVMKSKHRDHMAVVISTDHGQMLGPCVGMQVAPSGINMHGRTAFGSVFNVSSEADKTYVKDPNNSMVVLNPISFHLNEPTTIALKSFYFGGWTKDSQGRAWGVHGGLYPEEVVLGFSVLKRRPVRKQITAVISGTGEVGKTETTTLMVDNPNAAPIVAMTLTLNEISEYVSGEPLLTGVRSGAAERTRVVIQKFPAPTLGDKLQVSGSLLYEFEDGIQHQCEVTGTLVCKQMYSGQRPSLRDRVKR
jgi:hypothetical protein